MIIGELIGIIVLCIFWTLFIIGIFGLTHEFKKDILVQNPGMIALYLVFLMFGLTFGSILLFWYFKIIGISEILGSMFKGWWESRL